MTDAGYRNATRILVFDHGRVVESGSFDELIAKGGAFAALAKGQFLARDAAAPVAAPEPQAAPGTTDIVVPPANQIAENAAE